MLTQRQSDILRLIIQNYTSSGVPVGSKTLMAEGVEASPATIRNDMKALEDEASTFKDTFFFWTYTVCARLSLLCGSSVTTCSCSK